MAIALKTPAADESLSDNLCWLLARASHSLTTQLTSALGDLGVSPRAHCVLSTAMTGEFTQTALAQAVGVDKTTMVVTLDELERQGLAERRPSSKDRRARVVAVTKAGEKLVRRAEELTERVQEDVLATLPANERKALVGGLTHLVSGRLNEPVECSKPVRRRRAA
jgi:MarR family transcriptional regulator, transcriptional regulator for hemolysin